MSYFISIKNVKSVPKWIDNFINHVNLSKALTAKSEYRVLNEALKDYNIILEEIGNGEDWIFETEEDAIAFILKWS